MDFLKKRKEIVEQFDACVKEITDRNEIIKKAQTESAEFVDKQKQLQGSYSTITELGIEAGVFDSQGNVIVEGSAVPEKETATQVYEAPQEVQA